MAKEKKEKDQKDEALEEAIRNIEKTYGKGAVMKLGERPETGIDTIPTGSI